MNEITPELISKLVAFARKHGIPDRVDNLKENLLDHAYDELDFGGDEEDLWQRLRAELGAAPVQLKHDRRRQQHDRRASQPEAPRPGLWLMVKTAPLLTGL